MGKLTAKQERFVKEYLIDLNATGAYVRAGYSPKGADTAAYALLKNDYIKSLISLEQDKTNKKLEFTKEDIMEKLMAVIDTYLLSGNLTSQALKAIEIFNKMTGFNAPLESTINIKQEQPLFGPINKKEDNV